MPHLQQLHEISYNGSSRHYTSTMECKEDFQTMEWYKVKNEVHELILQATPIIIFWKIWKSWAACKNGDNSKFNQFKMVQKVACLINATLNTAYPNVELSGSWAEMCEIVGKLKPVVKWRLVSWKKDPYRDDQDQHWW